MNWLLCMCLCVCVCVVCVCVWVCVLLLSASQALGCFHVHGFKDVEFLFRKSLLFAFKVKGFDPLSVTVTKNIYFLCLIVTKVLLTWVRVGETPMKMTTSVKS